MIVMIVIFIFGFLFGLSAAICALVVNQTGTIIVTRDPEDSQIYTYAEFSEESDFLEKNDRHFIILGIKNIPRD